MLFFFFKMRFACYIFFHSFYFQPTYVTELEVSFASIQLGHGVVFYTKLCITAHTQLSPYTGIRAFPRPVKCGKLTSIEGPLPPLFQ